MRTIGIMTSEESFLNNYGAALQGYALFSMLKEWGYDPSIIRYNGYAPKRRFGNVKDFIKKVTGYKRDLYSPGQLERREQLQKIKEKYQADSDGRVTNYFKKFEDSHMKFASGMRYNAQLLKEHPPLFDMYVCGSDQIWNPIFHGGVCDPGYYLDFVPRGHKRIAYAPSLGTDELPESCIKKMKCYLSKMDALSVREESGAAILSELIGKPVRQMLDPTMMVDSSIWNKIDAVPANLPTEYILCYRFSDNLSHREKIQEIAELLNLPIISLPLTPVAMEDPFEKRFDAGPSEFVGMIKKAKLVCTDSFHATVFSILNHTPFVTFQRESYANKRASMNTRITSLLNHIGLQNRVISRDSSVNADYLLNVNFRATDKWLDEQRAISQAFLKSALEQ